MDASRTVAQMLVYGSYDGTGESIVSMNDLTIVTAAPVWIITTNSRWSERSAPQSPVTDKFKQGISSKILLGSRFWLP